MYGIFTNICPKNDPDLGKYSIHGVYGKGTPKSLRAKKMMDSAVYPPVIKDGNIGKWTMELGDFPIPTNLSSVRGFSVAMFDYQRVSHIPTACRSHFSNHLYIVYIREAITRIPHISTIVGSSLIVKRVHSNSTNILQRQRR